MNRITVIGSVAHQTLICNALSIRAKPYVSDKGLFILAITDDVIYNKAWYAYVGELGVSKNTLGLILPNSEMDSVMKSEYLYDERYPLGYGYDSLELKDSKRIVKRIQTILKIPEE